MKKIPVLSGSPRKNGDAASPIKAFAEGAGKGNKAGEPGRRVG